METEKNYVGYDYMDVTVKHGKEQIYTDSYPNFGWELEDNELSATEVNAVVLKFKRGRKIANKTELTRLQRQFEQGMKEVERLERSKAVKASACAYVVGVLGGGCIAGAVLFQVLAGLLALAIVFGAMGLIICTAAYVAYMVLSKRLAKQTAPVIEKQYEELYAACEEAAQLL